MASRWRWRRTCGRRRDRKPGGESCCAKQTTGKLDTYQREDAGPAGRGGCAREFHQHATAGADIFRGRTAAKFVRYSARAATGVGGVEDDGGDESCEPSRDRASKYCKRT